MEIASGEIVVLAGPSGCGKTTSLTMINRLVEPTSGTISIDGRATAAMDVNALRRSIGYVIQQVGLFPHQTVAENIATVPRLAGWNRRRIAARVDELLEMVGLPAAEYGRRLPADPDILLMDEPFGAIDPVVRVRLQNELLRLQKVLHKTIVFVTHDIDEAVRIGDRVALLSQGGVLEQFARPAELLAHPASACVAQFLGEGRMVRRLALLRVRDARLAAANGSMLPVETVSADASLRDALDAVLRSDRGRVTVRDADTVLGVIDGESIREASRGPRLWRGRTSSRLPGRAAGGDSSCVPSPSRWAWVSASSST
jgi:osmoprotectant transport system ATP-binding protein